MTVKGCRAQGFASQVWLYVGFGASVLVLGLRSWICGFDVQDLAATGCAGLGLRVSRPVESESRVYA